MFVTLQIKFETGDHKKEIVCRPPNRPLEGCDTSLIYVMKLLSRIGRQLNSFTAFRLHCMKTAYFSNLKTRGILKDLVISPRYLAPSATGWHVQTTRSRTVYDLQRFSVCIELLSVPTRAAGIVYEVLYVLPTPLHRPTLESVVCVLKIRIWSYYGILLQICGSIFSSQPPHFK